MKEEALITTKPVWHWVETKRPHAIFPWIMLIHYVLEEKLPGSAHNYALAGQ